MMKALMDGFIGKFISRTLMVFGVSSYFLYVGKITPDQWTEIAMIYLGAQKVLDWFKMRKEG